MLQISILFLEMLRNENHTVPTTSDHFNKYMCVTLNIVPFTSDISVDGGDMFISFVMLQ